MISVILPGIYYATWKFFPTLLRTLAVTVSFIFGVFWMAYRWGLIHLIRRSYQIISATYSTTTTINGETGILSDWKSYVVVLCLCHYILNYMFPNLIIDVVGWIVPSSRSSRGLLGSSDLRLSIGTPNDCIVRSRIYDGCFQHDNAPAHTSRQAKAVLRDLRLAGLD